MLPMFFRSVLAIAALVVSPGLALAQGTQVTFGGTKQDTSQPVEVSADALSVNQDDGSALYTGNVVIGQGDMRMAAPRVLVIYSEDNRRIDRMEATGGVTLVNGEEAAEAQRADYHVNDGNIVMSGNVLMTQGANALAADRMTVNLDDGTAQMSGRVRTIFQPKEE